MYSCATDALWRHNYQIAVKWWRKCSELGDFSCQLQLGNMYSDGSGVQEDLVQSYKWYDISAAMHGVYIDNLLPSAGGLPETNQLEINYRDGVAKRMAPEEVLEAQRQARAWLARSSTIRKR